MEELIKIDTRKDGRKAVSARALHEGLKASERFSNWFERYVTKYGFVDGQDFVGYKVYNALARQELQDYMISLDVAEHICKKHKSKEAVLLETFLKKQKGTHVVFKELPRPELQFETMLREFLDGWNIELLTQVQMCDKYKVDFLINSWLIVEYDEEHHKYQQKEDKEREEEINDWIKEYTGDSTYNFVFVRVEKGKELKGLHDIVSQLVAFEDLTSWDNKCKSVCFKYEYQEA